MERNLSPYRISWRMPDALGLAVCLAAAVLVQGWIAWGAGAVTGFSDAMHYVLVADFYKTWFHGGEDPIAVQLYRASRFPPLFPVILGALGAGSDAQPLAKQLTCAMAVLLTPLVWVWARRELGNSASACVVTLALVLNPGFFLLCLNPVSEPLAMLFIWGALLVAGNVPSHRSAVLVCALLLGAAALTRSICLVFALAWAIWLFRRGVAPRFIALLCALAAAPSLLWMLQRTGIAASDNYLRWLTPGQFANGLGGWPGMLYRQPLHLLDALAESLRPEVNGPALLASTMIAAFALAGWWLRIRRNCLDAWFLLPYAGVLLIWPFPEATSRLGLVVLPLIVLCACEGAAALVMKLPLQTVRRSTLALLLVMAPIALASAGTLGHFAWLATVEGDPALDGDRRDLVFFTGTSVTSAFTGAEMNARIRAVAIETGHIIGKYDCVYSAQPVLLALHGRVPSVRFPDVLRDDVPIEAQLNRCRFLFASVGDYSGTTQTGFHLLDRYGPIARPHLVSTMQVDGQQVVVAALFSLQKGPAPP